MDLANKVAIVTGSTSGIGKAIAVALAAAGAKVVINSANSFAEGEALAKSLPDAVYLQSDISDEEQAYDLVNSALKHWGKLDILINNAGYSQRIPHDDLAAATDEVFQKMWDINLMGTWYMCRAAMQHLQLQQNAHIINISSIAGVRATGSSIPYAISKAAVNHLTKLLANAAGPNVRVNAIAPGLINTPRTEGWQDIQTHFTERTALQSAGNPEDIAELTLGILRANYLTGEIIVCDGGYQL